MQERRFLVDPADLTEPTAPGAAGRAIVRGSEHHHLSRVLRLREGAEVAVFDGRGRGYLGRIESIRRDESAVILDRPDQRPAEAALRLTLAQGVPHHDRMEWVIQKSTELGVARILPVLSERSVIRAGEKGTGRIERWRRTAAEAARQCGRLVIPEVVAPLSWPETLELWRREGGGEAWIFSTTRGSPEPAAAATPRGGALLVAVGPEGGFTEDEERIALQAGLTPKSLGPRILRSETAGVVATALALFLAGDLGAGHGA